jgi:hypothetical protein
MSSVFVEMTSQSLVFVVFLMGYEVTAGAKNFVLGIGSIGSCLHG